MFSFNFSITRCTNQILFILDYESITEMLCVHIYFILLSFLTLNHIQRWQHMYPKYFTVNITT